MSVTRQGYKTAQDVYLLGGEVTIAGANSAGGAINTNIASTDIMQPVDIQSHYQILSQTHAGILIAPNTWNTAAAWIDTNGFDRIAVTLMNDASTQTSVNIVWSHDGVTQHGEDSGVIGVGTAIRKAGETATKARYAKVSISNADAAAHTMSAWAFLKA
jgi:hypothetical protein